MIKDHLCWGYGAINAINWQIIQPYILPLHVSLFPGKRRRQHCDVGTDY